MKRFKKNFSENSRWSKWLILTGTLFLLFTAVFLLVYFNPYFEDLHFKRIEMFLGSGIIYFVYFLLFVNLSILGYMLILHLKYKPMEAVSDDALPSMTVIVPAYNEGKLVYKTLRSLVQSDYPEDKLQILSIDDGSKDDTWYWIKRAKEEWGHRIEILKQPENRGKRQALYRGFQQGAGAIFVTVDSDSIVTKNTLRKMASPFVKDKNCGAVAGNVRVLNRKEGVIPRMLAVSFAFSFEFVRSAQSVLGAVFCTPGALSAYRREAVYKVLPDWINQTFLGRVSTIGEDRAMTNMILKQGYSVLFQRKAYVYTNTPKRYRNLHKMFTRWERSNVRETIAMSKFAFTNFREGPKTGIRVLLVYFWSRLLLSIPLLILTLVFVFTFPLLFLMSTCIGVLLFSSIQAIFYAKRRSIVDSLWAYPYSLFYAFTLFWITPYAILTARNGGWLTRELTKTSIRLVN